MNKQIRIMFPDCDKDEKLCFEHYIRDRIGHMKAFGLKHLKVGTFDGTYDDQFKLIAAELDGKFWWNVVSKNVGTVTDKFVYKFDLFLKE